MLKLYQIVSYLVYPFLPLMLLIRQYKGKEDVVRKMEKMGKYTIDRPNGKLVWIHCASVGESNSVLSLIDYIIDNNEDTNVLMTTGTVSSANLIVKKLNKKAIHQFNPLDCPIIINKFLDHWQPDSVIWTESELWPNTLLEIKRRRITAALINARMSEKAFRVWMKYPPLIEDILSTFSLCLTQTKKGKFLFEEMGAKNVNYLGNLKFTAEMPLIDNKKINELKEVIKERTVMCYSSTHKGEETIAFNIHKNLKKEFEDILTVIIPRHPNRKDELRKEFENLNLKVLFRSDGNLPTEDVDVYIADTLGEVGNFYSICPLVFMGGSFSPFHEGGHNPIEPLKFGCVVLTGNKISVFKEIFEDLKESCRVFELEEDLEKEILELIKNKEKLNSMSEKGLQIVGKDNTILEDILTELKKVKVI